ncbi:NUDIX domain-containing protein [Cupriavidus taiwanensis]|nr:NUDIX domain-containing protein [Cupriavidus taiwanensis]
MRQFDGQWRCLVLRAYRNWDFPKGQPEPSEELLQTALRETTEETSWNCLGARTIAKLSRIRRVRSGAYTSRCQGGAM